MDKVMELMSFYNEFRQDSNSSDIYLFADWLRTRHNKESQAATNNSEVNEAGVAVIAAYLIGGISSYVDVWVKLTFQETPLKSLSDYGILKCVQYAELPSKSFVSDQMVIEKTTCIEAIKRLIRDNLLQETIDKNDKRVHRLKLTEDGIKLLLTLDPKMRSLSKLLMANLTNEEIEGLIPFFKRLNDFHDNLYRNYSKAEVKTKFNI